MEFEEIFDFSPISNEDAYVKVSIGELVLPQDANTILKLLSSAAALEKYYLNHLKRIRRVVSSGKDDIKISTISYTLEIIICPAQYIDDFDASLLARFKNIRTVDVAKYEPRTREEFETWGRMWPTMFRPNDINREREKGLAVEFITATRKYMSMVHEDSLRISAKLLRLGVDVKIGGAIVITPSTGKVVMDTHTALEFALQKWGDQVLCHPLYSSTFLVIAAMSAVCRCEIQPLNEVPADQYLCTGLELYIDTEPDLSSGMALVHSRILSVVYRHESTLDGALGTHYKLHTLRSINHRFRVFKVKS
jgi:tRNA-specific adenosine deaminase 3